MNDELRSTPRGGAAKDGLAAVAVIILAIALMALLVSQTI